MGDSAVPTDQAAAVAVPLLALAGGASPASMTLVTQQVSGYLAQQRACPLQAAGESAYRTLFDTVAVPNPRWRQCACQPHDRHTLRPLAALLPERTSPELRYLETSWAADGSVTLAV